MRRSDLEDGVERLTEREVKHLWIRLQQMVVALGLEILPLEIEGIARKGLYLASERAILIDRRLPVSEQLIVLAHELGHHLCGHSPDGELPEIEDEADARGWLLLQKLA